MKDEFLYRLSAQAEEAETLGLTKLAEHLCSQIEHLADEKQESFEPFTPLEVEAMLWTLFLKQAESKDGKYNAVKVQYSIEAMAKDIGQTFQNLIK